ncbi:MAG TPA: DinB family protein [Puia sp.]|nr:DinB family protein [Puia sp.]
MPLSASVLARLQYQHQTIDELITGLSEEELRRRIYPDKWSAFENIAHLAAYQPVFFERLVRMQQDTAPAFERYVAENDPLFPGYVDRTLEQLLRDIRKERSRILSELEGMSEATLQRTGRHPKFGLFPLATWTEFFLLHEAHHLFTIFPLVQELRKGQG